MFFYAIGYSFSLIASILMTRHLGPEGRGLVTSIASLISIGSVLALFGMTHVNKLVAAENKDAAGALFLVNIFICIASSIIIVPLIYWLGKNPELSGKNSMLLVSGLLFIPVFAIAASCNDILMGMHKSREYNTIFIVEKVLYAALIMAAISLGLMTVPVALALFYTSQVIRIILFCFFLSKYFSLQQLRKVGLLKLDGNFILVNYYSSICFAFSSSILPILLSRFSSLDETGYYAVARMVADMLVVPSTLYSSYAINKLAGEREKPNYLKTKIILIISIMSFAAFIALAFYLISEPLIPLLFGRSFKIATTCFRYLLPSVIFVTGYQMMNVIMLVEKKSGNILFLVSIYALLPAILPFVIFHKIDAVTAADSYSIACLVTFIAAVFLNIRSFLPRVSAKFMT